MKLNVQFSLVLLLWSLTMSPGICSTADGVENKSAQAKYRISSVCVEGNKLIPTDEILARMKTQVGGEFIRNQVFDDLKTINEMGFFETKSLRIVPMKQDDGLVKLIVYVKENPTLTRFSFDGNHVFSTARLSEFFSSQIGKPQNLAVLSSAIDRLEAAYHKEGYILARVTDVQDSPDGSVELKLEEGQIGEVRIKGFDREQEAVVRRSINIPAYSIYNELSLLRAFMQLSSGEKNEFAELVRRIAPSETKPSVFSLVVERRKPEDKSIYERTTLRKILERSLLQKERSNVVPALLSPSERLIPGVRPCCEQ